MKIWIIWCTPIIVKSIEYSSVPHRPPQFNSRTAHFQHPKSLGSTPKTPQFHTLHLLVLKEGFLVWNWWMWGTEGFFVWNWRVWGTEGFWCGTEEFLGRKSSSPFVLNWCVKLKGCWTEETQIKSSRSWMAVWKAINGLG